MTQPMAAQIEFSKPDLPPQWVLIGPVSLAASQRGGDTMDRLSLRLHNRSSGANRAAVHLQRWFRQLDDLALLRSPQRQRLHCTGIEGIQHVDEAMAAGNGVILLTAHFCVTRIAVRCLATVGYPVLTVHKQTPRKLSEGHLGNMLRQHYLELWRQGNPDVVDIQDADCSLKMLQRLRSGGLVHMHVDALSAIVKIQRLLIALTIANLLLLMFSLAQPRLWRRASSRWNQRVLIFINA